MFALAPPKLPRAYALLFSLMIGIASPAAAVLPGRAWAPAAIRQSGLGPTISPVLMNEASGTLRLYGSVPYLPTPAIVGFVWSGTDWTEDWHYDRRPSWVYGALAPSNDTYLLSQDTNAWWFMVHRAGDSYVVENIAQAGRVDQYNFAADASSPRRWFAGCDVGGNRLFYSDQVGAWNEIPITGSGANGIAVASLGDSTALVVWIDPEYAPGQPNVGVFWGIASGATWTPDPTPLLCCTAGQISYDPQLRHRPGGGVWLAWARDEPYITLTAFQAGIWSPLESVTANYRSTTWPWAQYSKSVALSQDLAQECPTIAWSGFDGERGVGTVCTSAPSACMWPVGDELLDDDEGMLPTVARDANDDIWVAFYRLHQTGLWWTHTYTRAFASVPLVYAQGDGYLVRWTLDEPAPGTWWTVLGEQENGSYTSLARIQAADSLEMSYFDPGPCVAPRYRIRRECVDTNYQWLSEVSNGVVAVAPSVLESRLALAGFNPNPASGGLHVAFTLPSDSPAILEILTVNGRRVLRRQVGPLGAGHHVLDLDRSTGMRPGVYCLRLTQSGKTVTAQGVITR